VKAVATARGRTSDGLGTQYPAISQQLWAVQAGVSGASDPASALDDAQTAVETSAG
jgi:multiple sugar transport system substrate-binding protein